MYEVCGDIGYRGRVKMLTLGRLCFCSSRGLDFSDVCGDICNCGMGFGCGGLSKL